jgi:hypothetical protein
VSDLGAVLGHDLLDPLARWPWAESMSLKSCGLDATSAATSSATAPESTPLSSDWSNVCMP